MSLLLYSFTPHHFINLEMTGFITEGKLSFNYPLFSRQYHGLSTQRHRVKYRIEMFHSKGLELPGGRDWDTGLREAELDADRG